MKRFQLNVNLNSRDLIEARANTDNIRAAYQDALNDVGAHFNPLLAAAVAAEQVAGDAVSVELVTSEIELPSPTPAETPIGTVAAGASASETPAEITPVATTPATASNVMTEVG